MLVRVYTHCFFGHKSHRLYDAAMAIFMAFHSWLNRHSLEKKFVYFPTYMSFIDRLLDAALRT